MSELDLYKAFFQSWEELNKLPNKRGAPSMERKAAVELLEARANAVRRFNPAEPVAVGNDEVAAFRSLNAQIAAIPPAKGPKPADAVVISKGVPAQVPHG